MKKKDKSIVKKDEESIMKKDEEITCIERTESLVIVLRGQPILVDKDVASLYSVSTKEINQALRNNPEKFPEGYVFPLQVLEKQELVKNFDRFKTMKHSGVEPNAFTEKGLYMLATILKSPEATKVTLAIIETFAKVRETERMIHAASEAEEEVKPSLLKSLERNVKDIFVNNLPLNMKKATLTFNLGVFKIAVSSTWKKKRG